MHLERARLRTSLLVRAAVAGIALTTTPVSAAYILVYGSPAFTSGVGGFQGGDVLAVPGSGVNSAGTAVGYATKYDSSSANKGYRAVRWDGSGTAIELGNLGTDTSGVTSSVAWAVNTAGTAVGSANKYDGSGVYKGDRAVRWNGSGTAATELGNLGTNTSGATFSNAYAVNTAGTAVGYATKYDGSGAIKGDRAARWDGSGTATELGNLGTDSSGSAVNVANAVNGLGTAVGSAEKYDGLGVYKGTRAVRWDASGTAATELGNLGTNTSGETSTSANAVNTAGTAVGSANRYDGSGAGRGFRAVRWDASGTGATELGNLGTNTSGLAFSSAYAVNAAGTAVGYATIYNGTGVDKGYRALRWDASGTAATELGNLGTSVSGFTSSFAYAVNTAGTAVGSAVDYDSAGTFLGEKAVYWLFDGLAIDLNTFIAPNSGWILNEAMAISDTNWVSGVGTFDPDGAGGQAAYTRLFLLDISSAVPEPTGLALLSLGGVAMVRGARRR
jgi:hypothetical protein